MTTKATSRFWKHACPGGPGHVYETKSFDYAYRCPKCRREAGVTLAEAIAFARGHGDPPLRGKERSEGNAPKAPNHANNREESED
jgi:hypothetical protein